MIESFLLNAECGGRTEKSARLGGAASGYSPAARAVTFALSGLDFEHTIRLCACAYSAVVLGHVVDV